MPDAAIPDTLMLDTALRAAGLTPDRASREVLAADLARLRGLTAIVHGVREAVELDGALIFRAAATGSPAAAIEAGAES